MTDKTKRKKRKGIERRRSKRRRREGRREGKRRGKEEEE